MSANSLPIAIHDLRRALGDDAKRPMYLETVSKGGYRLIAPKTISEGSAESPVAPSRRPYSSLRTIAVSAAIMLGALAVIAVGRFGEPTPLIVVVGEVANATSDPAYDGLARASDGVLLAALHDQPRIRIIRSESCNRCDIRFTARLVLWSGLPDVVMVAEGANTAEVVWSGFAFGPEASLPAKIEASIAQFAAASRNNFETPGVREATADAIER